jgi:hypothetical protein
MWQNLNQQSMQKFVEKYNNRQTYIYVYHIPYYYISFYKYFC